MSDRIAQIRTDENWSRDDVRKFNGWSQQVTRALNGGLTFEDNVRSAWITTTFIGPASSLSIKTDFTVEPMAVFLAKLRDSSGTAFGATLAWSFSAGYIVTTSFGALSAGSYTATLLVIAS